MTPDLLERARAALSSAVLCLAVLSPMVPWDNGKRHDDYPLSWYPMFRGVRPERERIVWVRATLADGTTRRVSYRYWTPGGLSEGGRHLERAVKEGDAAAFCERLAEEFGERTRGWASRATTVEIVRSTFVLADYFADEKSAARESPPPSESERVVQRCEVRR